MLLVTVVVCTYNSEKTIIRALDSIFAQKGYGVSFGLEVIVVDDCSKDQTLALIKDFPVTVWVNPENSGGPNKGRNRALTNCGGDYIAFLDHDDEWLPDKISDQLEAIKDEKIATSGYLDIDIHTGIKRVVQNEGEGLQRYATNATFMAKLTRVKQAQKTYFGSIMIHKDLKHILFEETFGMVDYDWVLRIFEGQHSVEVLKPLFVRYVDGHNLSLNEQYRLNDFQIASQAIASYGAQYPQEARLGLKRLHGSMARYYYLIGKLPECRTYLLKANLTLINALYWLTSFWGRSFVVKRFKVFG